MPSHFVLCGLLSLSHSPASGARACCWSAFSAAHCGPRSFGAATAPPAQGEQQQRCQERAHQLAENFLEPCFEAPVEVGVDRQVVGQQLRVELFDIGGALLLLPAVDREQAGDQQQRRQQHAQRKAAQAAEAADQAAAGRHARPAERRRALGLFQRERALARRAQPLGDRRAGRSLEPRALVQGLADLVGEFDFVHRRLSRTLKRYAAAAKRCRQCMRRPGAVRFHAALRASHGLGGLRDVQFLPVTQQESLALTRRELGDLFFNYFKNLSPFQPLRRTCLAVGVAGLLQGLQRILVVVLAAPRREAGQQRGPQSSAPSGGGTSRGSRSAGCAGTAAPVPRARGRHSSATGAASRPARCRARPPRRGRRTRPA